MEETRGVFAGGEPPSDDSTDPLEGLYEFKLRDSEGYDDPVDLETDIIDIILESGWNSNGRIFMRQVDPLPFTLLSVVPSGFLPFRG